MHQWEIFLIPRVDEDVTKHPGDVLTGEQARILKALWGGRRPFSECAIVTVDQHLRTRGTLSERGRLRMEDFRVISNGYGCLAAYSRCCDAI